MHRAKGDRFVRANELPVCDNVSDGTHLKSLRDGTTDHTHYLFTSKQSVYDTAMDYDQYSTLQILISVIRIANLSA